MRLVVDANILFSAVLRDGATRRLVLEGALDLHAPEWIWEEVEANAGMLVARSGADRGSLDLLIALLRDKIQSVPSPVSARFLDNALARLHPEDSADAPYVATAMALKASLWSHDKRLSGKAGVDVVTTKDLLDRESA